MTCYMAKSDQHVLPTWQRAQLWHLCGTEERVPANSNLVECLPTPSLTHLHLHAAAALLGPAMRYARLLHFALHVPAWGKDFIQQRWLHIKVMQLGFVLPLGVVLLQIKPVAERWGISDDIRAQASGYLMLLAGLSHLLAFRRLCQVGGLHGLMPAYCPFSDFYYDACVMLKSHFFEVKSCANVKVLALLRTGEQQRWWSKQDIKSLHMFPATGLPQHRSGGVAHTAAQWSQLSSGCLLAFAGCRNGCPCTLIVAL